MADYKSGYSDASTHYVSNTIMNSEVDMKKYKESKAREVKYNDNWSRQKVNINDIVDKFAPNSSGKVKGMKYLFKGSKYTVIADMSVGYLRIKENKTKKFINLDGTYGNRDTTHFKILKREEM